MVAIKKGKQPETLGEINVVENYYTNGKVLVISNSDSKPNEDLMLDIAFTIHTCHNCDLFLTYEEVSRGVVMKGNDIPCRIVGIEGVKIKMFDGIVRALDEMRHVQDMKRNLISLRILDSKEYKYTNESGVLKVSKCA